MMTKTRIDPPVTRPGESRCVHDMLDGTCAICRGLPDVPELMPWDSYATVADTSATTPAGASSLFRIEKAGRCVRCDAKLPVGALVFWSDGRAGIQGTQCCPEDDL